MCDHYFCSKVFINEFCKLDVCTKVGQNQYFLLIFVHFLSRTHLGHISDGSKMKNTNFRVEVFNVNWINCCRNEKFEMNGA